MDRLNKNIYIVFTIFIAYALLMVMNSFDFFTIRRPIIDKGYKNILFSDEVHLVDIRISEDNWNDILTNPLKEEYYPCDIVIDNVIFKNVGIRTKGNTSLELVAENANTDRYSFKVKFDEYVDDQTCYGLDELSLNNLIADSTYMKEYLSYDMFEYMGVDAPLCSFMNITINGKPWGLYVGVEVIDKSFLTRNYGENYGKLYKPESAGLRYYAQMGEGDREVKGEDLVYIDDNFDTYFTIFDTAKTDIVDGDKTRLINSLRVLNSGSNLETVVDIDNTVKYWVVNNFMCNFDSYLSEACHNFYLYENGGVMTLLPWDYNLSFGSYPHTRNADYTYDLDDATNMVNMPMLDPLNANLFGKRPFFEKIIEDDGCKELYLKYTCNFIENYFDSGYFEKKYNETVAMIYPYICEDATAFYELKDIEKGQAVLKEFIDLRVESVKGQLNGSVIADNYDTYIDASHIIMEDTGHLREGYMPI